MRCTGTLPMADGAWQDGCHAYVTHEDFDRFVIAPHHPDRLRRAMRSNG
jgi:hypothetical protein